nr:MAG TPA: hypothetical protein [Caudoviricetes sp.]
MRVLRLGFLLVELNTERKKREMGDLSDHSQRDI